MMTTNNNTADKYTMTEAICGPKSWKQNKYTPDFIVEDLRNTVDQFSHCIQIPKKPPIKPIEGSIHFTGLMFPMGTTNKDDIYATGTNIVRWNTMADDYDICGVCHGGNCQEFAARNWYGLTKWKRCHLSCWKNTCHDYYIWLETLQQNEVNSVQNFIRFLYIQNLINN